MFLDKDWSNSLHSIIKVHSICEKFKNYIFGLVIGNQFDGWTKLFLHIWRWVIFSFLEILSHGWLKINFGFIIWESFLIRWKLVCKECLYTHWSNFIRETFYFLVCKALISTYRGKKEQVFHIPRPLLSYVVSVY